RLANEIRGLKRHLPHLTHISLVGNSLGGLYARYAAHLLHDPGDKTIAGLMPETFLTIATPHLGVRRHTWVPLPDQVHGAVAVFMGQTGQDLFLRDAVGKGEDEEPLLLHMATSEPFLSSLRAFKRRCAYANASGDFMVPYETAAFIHHEEQLPPFLSNKSIVERVLGKREGEILGIVDQKEKPHDRDVGLRVKTKAREFEIRMAHGLESLGWRRVVVDFGGLIPLSHNK
ncbi:unnamed protein product, partial [Chrysoparadoxa australica]